MGRLPLMAALSGLMLFAVMSANACGGGGSSFKVPKALAISSTAFDAGLVGVAYADTVTATGGKAPYTFTVDSTTLPQSSLTDPLLMSTDGELAGTPIVAATFQVLVTVTDAAGTSVQKALELIIDNTPAIAVDTADFSGTPPTALPNAHRDSAYEYTFSATGGTATGYEWTQTGSLDPTIWTFSLVGVLTGTPPDEGSWPFTVTVTDSFGNSTSLAVTLTADIYIPTDTTPSLHPPGRLGHCAAWYDTGTAATSRMLIWGGYQSSTANVTNEGWVFDPETNTWGGLGVGAGGTTVPPDARRDAVCVFTGSGGSTPAGIENRLLIWGGSDGLTDGLATGGIYNAATDTWDDDPAAPAVFPDFYGSGPTPPVNIPAGRTGHCAVWGGNAMYVFFGKNSLGALVSDAWVWDPTNDQWTQLEAIPGGLPSGQRVRASAVWDGANTTVYIFGGCDSAGNPLGDGLAYDVAAAAGSRWSAIPTTGAPSARSGHIATRVFNGSVNAMVIWGGGSGPSGVTNALADGAVLDLDATPPVWSAISTTSALSGRISAAFAVKHDTGDIYIYGGSDGAGGMRSDGARLTVDASSTTWDITTTFLGTGAPDGRSGSTAFYTGTRFLLWGGASDTAPTTPPEGFMLTHP